jgi:glycosidase
MSTLAEMNRLDPAGVLDGTFITNHDTPRVASELGSDPVRLRSAAALLLTLPGTPYIYYGEEVGLAGGKPDPNIRTPMPWNDREYGGGFTTGAPWRSFSPGREQANVAAQADDPRSLLSCYRWLIHTRATLPALRRGSMKLMDAGAASDQVLAFVREADGERVLVAHNLGASTASVGPWDLKANAAMLVLATVEGVTARGAGGVMVTVPAGGSAIWRLR